MNAEVLRQFIQSASEWGPYAIGGLAAIGTGLLYVKRILPSEWKNVSYEGLRNSSNEIIHQWRTRFGPIEETRSITTDPVGKIIKVGQAHPLPNKSNKE